MDFERIKYMKILILLIIILISQSCRFDVHDESQHILNNVDTVYIHIPIFLSGTVKLNGLEYLRENTNVDTTYSQSYKNEWYERITITSDLK